MRRYLVLGVLTLFVVAGAHIGASAACRGQSPDIVLECFSRAYSERDLAMLESVLAPDYVWVAVAPPEVDVFPRKDSVESSVRMFNNPDVEWVTLEFREGYDVSEGRDPGTWRLENLQATMKVKRASLDDAAEAPLCVTLYVREVAGDSPGYQVFREVFFEGEGCVGK